jgi:hypothetical protein
MRCDRPVVFLLGDLRWEKGRRKKEKRRTKNEEGRTKKEKRSVSGG